MYLFDTAINVVTSSNVCVQHVFDRDVLQPRVLKEEGDLIVGYHKPKIFTSTERGQKFADNEALHLCLLP